MADGRLSSGIGHLAEIAAVETARRFLRLCRRGEGGGILGEAGERGKREQREE